MNMKKIMLSMLTLTAGGAQAGWSDGFSNAWDKVVQNVSARGAAEAVGVVAIAVGAYAYWQKCKLVKETEKYNELSLNTLQVFYDEKCGILRQTKGELTAAKTEIEKMRVSYEKADRLYKNEVIYRNLESSQPRALRSRLVKEQETVSKLNLELNKANDQLRRLKNEAEVFQGAELPNVIRVVDSRLRLEEEVVRLQAELEVLRKQVADYAGACRVDISNTSYQEPVPSRSDVSDVDGLLEDLYSYYDSAIDRTPSRRNTL